MANTYVWTIDKLHTKNLKVGGTTYTDVVVRIQATFTGTSGDDSSITSTHESDLDMNTSGIGESFTAYDNITEANAISWVESRMTSDTITSIKEFMDGQLQFKLNIKDASEKTGFPWS
tara:strand:- start:7440 stop:7793 length:354 start_codon:yes stop_codon:yes gene_type:complete